MRKFSSYGPIDQELHFHVPRTELIQDAYTRLIGTDQEKGGHYITIWSPRQTGKTWVMQQTVQKIKQTHHFDVGIISMQNAEGVTTEKGVLEVLTENMQNSFEKKLPRITQFKQIPSLFTKEFFKRPVILVLDEFDALEELYINRFTAAFRHIAGSRKNEPDKSGTDKTYLLHGLALIGVRSVLGIENKSGSPFNVQQGLHIPNLTFAETQSMFNKYETTYKQIVEADVVQNVFNVTRGQPGLTSWFGELLTERFNEHKDQPIGPTQYDRVLEAAVNLLPNVNVINIISKANQEPYKELVLEMFRTDEGLRFKFDDQKTNFLYMNGVVEAYEAGNRHLIRFANPFLQKRLFNYFSDELFKFMDRLVDPMDTLQDVFIDDGLNIRNIIRRYQTYLDKNRHWLFDESPRRRDKRIYEAVFHFNIYMFLFKFIESHGGHVIPEFPTGNGKIDIIIKYRNRTYGIELKTYTDAVQSQEAVTQAAIYGKKLGLTEITLLFFIDTIDRNNRDKIEVPYLDKNTNVTVRPVFVETENKE